MIRYGGRLFRAVSSDENGQVDSETIFKYEQHGTLVTATYSGGRIHFGQILGQMRDNGQLDMRYHHVTHAGELMTGICITTPEFTETGKMRLHERWQWTCGDQSTGRSTLEEI